MPAAAAGDSGLKQSNGSRPRRVAGAGVAADFGVRSAACGPKSRKNSDRSFHGLPPFFHRFGCYRVLRPDGSLVWLEDTSHAFFDEQGKMMQMIGMVADVTERKRAEAELSSVSRRLIQAQEQERTRIARELHDDINQQIALVAMELDQLEQDSPILAGATFLSRLEGTKKRLLDIGKDIQAMSHRLHSSKLEYLGIVTAARGFCREFSEQQKLDVDFTYSKIPPALPPDISLCLFRVLQEALQNAAKTEI